MLAALHFFPFSRHIFEFLTAVQKYTFHFLFSILLNTNSIQGKGQCFGTARVSACNMPVQRRRRAAGRDLDLTMI